MATVYTIISYDDSDYDALTTFLGGSEAQLTTPGQNWGCGIVDVYKAYYAYGILDTSNGYHADGIWTGGTHYAEGIWTGSAYHGNGILDGSNIHHADGILDAGYIYYDGGIWTGLACWSSGIWTGAEYEANGVLEADNTHYALDSTESSPYLAGLAAQLATDQAAVSAKKAYIYPNASILSQNDGTLRASNIGTLAGTADLTAAVLALGTTVDNVVGTLTGGAMPAVGDVEAGVVYGGGTGTFVAPDVTDVRAGIGYGAAGTEFVGTLIVVTGNSGTISSAKRGTGIAGHWMDKIVHLERADIKRDSSQGPQREWRAQSADVKAAIWPASQEMRDDYARRDIVVTHSIATKTDLLAKPGDRIVRTGDTVKYYVIVGIQDYDNRFLSDVIYLYDCEVRYN